MQFLILFFCGSFLPIFVHEFYLYENELQKLSYIYI